MERFPFIDKYGRRWEMPGTSLSHLDVELMAYRLRLSPEEGGLGASEHFKRICKALDPQYVWMSDFEEIPYESRWNDLMAEFCCKTNWLAVSGPASSGKSAFFARFLAINWLAHFGKCAVIVTSTTKAGARTRIWAHIMEFFQRIQGVFPIHINDTTCVISIQKGVLPSVSDRSSIMLVTPEKDKAGSGDSKLIGLHNDWVYVIGDEYSDMSPALANACENLKSNPNFFAAFLANAKSIFDPHGMQCQPKSKDWTDVSDNDLWWETERGLCLHLDGEKTPNRYVNDRFSFLQRWKEIQDEQDAGRSNTPGYWRYKKAFWVLSGEEDCLYSQLDITLNGCDKPAVWRGGDIVELASFDPANKVGGDNWQACYGKLGTDRDGKRVLEASKMIALTEDVRSDTESTTKQIARQFVDGCKERGIGVRQVAVDCTGGGSHVANAIEDAFGQKGVMRIEFGSMASETPAGERNGKPIKARDRYGRRDAELWHAGIDYVKSGQLRGINSVTAEQMTKRRAYTQNGKEYVESKKDYKDRTKLGSCDEADSLLILLALARERFSFGATSITAPASRSQDWSKAFAKYAPAKREGEQRLAKWGSL